MTTPAGYGTDTIVGQSDGLPEYGWTLTTVPDGYTGAVYGARLIVGGPVAEAVPFTVTGPNGETVAGTVDVVEDGLLTADEVSRVVLVGTGGDLAVSTGAVFIGPYGELVYPTGEAFDVTDHKDATVEVAGSDLIEFGTDVVRVISGVTDNGDGTYTLTSDVTPTSLFREDLGDGTFLVFGDEVFDFLDGTFVIFDGAADLADGTYTLN